MKQFIEKLIGRLEEQRGHICNCMPCNGCKYIGDCNEGEFAEDVALDKAIEIVNQLAEEYKQQLPNDLMIVSSLPSLYPLQDFEAEAIHRVVGNTDIPEMDINELFEEVEQNDGWIPCSQRLPEDCTIYEVTARFGNGMCYTEFAYYDESKGEWWKHDDDGLVNVLAWKEHSVPYQPKGE